MEDLPRNKDDRPTLSDLPRSQWYILLTALSGYKEVQQTMDLRSFLDQRKDPGYIQSMMNLFDKELVPAKNSGQKDMNDEDYTRMHNLASEFLPDDKRERARLMGGIDKSTNISTLHTIPTKKKAGILLDTLRMFQEIQKDHFNGLLLFQQWQSEQVYIEQIVDDITKSPPKAITVGWLRHN